MGNPVALKGPVLNGQESNTKRDSRRSQSEANGGRREDERFLVVPTEIAGEGV